MKIETFELSDEIDYGVGPSDAICLECGTTIENLKNGFCINNHDNWLEVTDDAYRFEIAMKKFGLTISQLIEAIETGTDLKPLI